MLDQILNTPLNYQSSIFPNHNDQSTNVLNAGRREVVKNSKKIGRQSSKLIHLLK